MTTPTPANQQLAAVLTCQFNSITANTLPDHVIKSLSLVCGHQTLLDALDLIDRRQVLKLDSNVICKHLLAAHLANKLELCHIKRMGLKWLAAWSTEFQQQHRHRQRQQQR
ncbi:hypothetical protein OIO90_003442 [Microbotryomycetes sp. JL221]|nr:hypothetical protein OIO90_003442 [Microbotryomycetes sp. JL221]